MEDTEVTKPRSFGNEFKTQLSTSAFEALEREFNQVLSDIDGDPSLAQFRIEYEKIYRILKRSHEQEKRLVKKCRELNTEIVTNAAKVQTALKLSQEDQDTISTLRKDSERAWNMVDNLHEKEIRANETTAQLQEEVTRISELVAKSNRASAAQERQLKDLRFENDSLKIELEKKIATKKSLEAQLLDSQKQAQATESENDTLKESLAESSGELYTCKTELRRERDKRKETENELMSSDQKLEEKSVECDELKYAANSMQAKVKELENQLSEAKAMMEKYLNDYDQLSQREQNLSKEAEDQKKKNISLGTDLYNAQQELKLLNSEKIRLSSEKMQLERKVDQGKKNVMRYQKMLDEMKVTIRISQTDNQTLKREVNQLKQTEDQSKRQIDLLNQEKNVHLDRIQRTEDGARRADEETHQQEQTVISLEKELAIERKTILKHCAEIRKLEQKCQHFELKVGEHKEECQAVAEEVRLRDIEIQDLKTKLLEFETELKQEKQQYDNVRTERNRFSMRLIEAEAAKEELKKKIVLLEQSSKQLRGEIASKESMIVKEHFDWKREKTQREQHRNEISRLKNLIEVSNDSIHKQDIEIKRYEGIVRKMNNDALMQRKEYDQVIHERDILGTQLIRRNDELALLYEKIKIQQNALHNGEIQYQSKIEDIRLLLLKIKDLQRKISIAKGGAGNIDDVKRELIQKHRELLREKTKVKALSEELENPMNVHRWRKLEGSDPATYEMIQKIQILQKRLIKKTEEIIEKDVAVQEKSKSIFELKKILARQPGPDIAEKMNECQTNLREKSRQMKAMAGELNMYQAQVSIDSILFNNIYIYFIGIIFLFMTY